MALKVGIKLNTNDERRFNTVITYLQNIDKNLDPILENAAEKAVARMHRDAPKDTRRLDRNITAQKTIDGFTITSTAKDPDTGYDYAPVQNFGGRFIAATMYFTKNIRYFNNKVKRDVRKLFKNTVTLSRL